MKKVLVCVIAGLVVLAGVQPAVAGERVVTPAELQQAARAQTAAGEEHRERLTEFFRGEQGRQTLEKMKLDLRQVEQAVAQLSDEEAASFAGRVQQAEKDFAAGQLTNQQITYILIAVVTAIIVIILLV